MHQKHEKHEKLDRLDPKEIELPETTYIHDIENRVFQSIVLQSLAKVTGIGFPEGTLIDTLLAWDGAERTKGIHITQDQKKQSLDIRIEINVEYGISLPEKAEEIQDRVVEEVVKFTGLHVACVHVVFKNLLPHHKERPDDTLSKYTELEDAR